MSRFLAITVTQGFVTQGRETLLEAKAKSQESYDIFERYF